MLAVLHAALTVLGSSPKPPPMLGDMSQVHGSKGLAVMLTSIQSAGVTPEVVNLINSMQTRKCGSENSTLALKPRADITRSPKQAYQWPNKKDLYPLKILKNKKKLSAAVVVKTMELVSIRLLLNVLLNCFGKAWIYEFVCVRVCVCMCVCVCV